MAEYIERRTAIEAAKHAWAKGLEPSQYIETLPAADVAPVRRGHWIEGGDCQICSECGEVHCWDEYRSAYCDSCGAKMDGGDNDAKSM